MTEQPSELYALCPDCGVFSLMREFAATQRIDEDGDVFYTCPACHTEFDELQVSYYWQTGTKIKGAENE